MAMPRIVPEKHLTHFPGRVLQVTRTDDLIAHEDLPRSMSCNLHGYPLGNPCIDHVPHRCTSKVVLQLSPASRLLTSLLPRFTNILPLCPPTMPVGLRE